MAVLSIWFLFGLLIFFNVWEGWSSPYLIVAHNHLLLKRWLPSCPDKQYPKKCPSWCTAHGFRFPCDYVEGFKNVTPFYLNMGYYHIIININSGVNLRSAVINSNLSVLLRNIIIHTTYQPHNIRVYNHD